jgi:SAM-dependent methyltransferase
MENQRFWNSNQRAHEYATRDHLYPAEARFIDAFREDMPTWRMIDLGIGGGRSTVHFAPLVADYVGTEYSQVMLEECRARFGEPAAGARGLSLRQADARDLSAFAEASFDLVLFSFNGIDEVDHRGRMDAFVQIHRVMKPNGIFLFSSHNLLVADRLFRFSLSRHPRRLLRNAWRFLRIRAANSNLTFRLPEEGYALIHDYPTDWTKFTYYVKPDEQLAQLGASGFHDATLYAGGSEEGVEANAQDTDAWLYYLCRA